MGDAIERRVGIDGTAPAAYPVGGSVSNVLTPKQREIAARVLVEEERARHHVVIALSGAHAY